MKRNESVKKIMTAQVTTVNVSQKLSEVRKILAEQSIHHVPVVSGTKLVGMISATDMVRLTLTVYGADQRQVDAMLDHQFKIEDVMTKELRTIDSRRTVREAAAALREGKFHSLPVVDEDQHLVGLVTSTDLIEYLLDQY